MLRHASKSDTRFTSCREPVLARFALDASVIQLQARRDGREHADLDNSDK